MKLLTVDLDAPHWIQGSLNTWLVVVTVTLKLPLLLDITASPTRSAVTTLPAIEAMYLFDDVQTASPALGIVYFAPQLSLMS